MQRKLLSAPFLRNLGSAFELALPSVLFCLLIGVLVVSLNAPAALQIPLLGLAAAGLLTNALWLLATLSQRARDAALLRQQAVDEFWRIFDHSPAPTSLLRANGVYLNVNQAWLEQWGYTREEVIGHTSVDFKMWPDAVGRETVGRETAGREILGAMVEADGVVRGFEAQLRRQCGELRTAIIRLHEVTLGGEKFWLGTTYDITEPKRAETALQEGEKRLRAFIESGLDAVYLLQSCRDKTGHIVDFIIADANPRAEQITQRSRASMIGQKVGDLFPLAHRLGIIEKHRTVLETHIPLEEELAVPNETGHNTWLYHQVVPVNDGLIVTIRDIAERKRIESELIEQRNLAEAMRDTIVTISGTLDLDVMLNRILESVERVVPHDAATIGLFDDAGMRLTYFRHYEPETQAFLQTTLFPPDHPVFSRAANAKEAILIADTHQDPTWEIIPVVAWIRSYLGMVIHVRGMVFGLLDLVSRQPNFFTPAHAERLQVFGSQAAIALENAKLYTELSLHTQQLERHVTERTAELTQANERLREMDRLKSKFITDVSHELRTPTTNINLRLYLLEHDKKDRFTEHIQMLKAQVDHLNRLLENVLDFTRVEELGGNRRNFAPVDLNKIVQDVISTVEPGAAKAGLQLSFLPDPELPRIEGNAQDLMSIVENLVSNAIKYNHPNGSINVSTHYLAESQTLSLSVEDTGIGIPRDDQPYIFDQFYRGQMGSTSIRGSGLGLAIVKELVERHSGRIQLTSNPSGGTTFTVFLPLTHHLSPNSLPQDSLPQ